MSQTIIDRLNKRMPPKINISSVVYEAIFGAFNFTPAVSILQSSDFNCGAIANEIEYVRGFVNFVASCYTLDSAQAEYLDELASFLTTLKRAGSETDAMYLNRLHSLFRRQGSIRWPTVVSMLDVFSYYVAAANLFAEESFVETTSGFGTGDDVLLNGGFELFSAGNFTSWTKTVAGTSTVTQDTTNMLEGGSCALFSVDASNSNAMLAQTVAGVIAGGYTFHIYYKDTAPVILNGAWQLSIQRSGDSKYYNFATDQWQVAVVYKTFASAGNTKYAHAFAYVSVGSTYDLTMRVQRIDGAAAGAYTITFDRAMFGKRYAYPSIKIIAQSIGQAGAFLSFTGGTIDNLIDRGECESATAPAMAAETTNTLTSMLQLLQSATHHFYGLYSMRLTKNVAAGTVATCGLTANENTTNMHGLVAATQYTMSAEIYCATAGGPASSASASIELDEYYAGTWHVAGSAAVPAVSFDAWKYVVLTATLNAATTGVRVRVVIASTEASAVAIYVDDIRLYPGTEQNLLYCGFFDNDYFGGDGGAYNSSIYTDLINRIKASGVKAQFEYISRNG